MRLFQNLSIRRKLTLIIMVTTCAAMFIACAVFLGFDIYNFRQSKVHDLETLAEILAANSTAAMTFSEARTVETAERSIGSDHGGRMREHENSTTASAPHSSPMNRLAGSPGGRARIHSTTFPTATTTRAVTPLDDGGAPGPSPACRAGPPSKVLVAARTALQGPRTSHDPWSCRGTAVSSGAAQAPPKRPPTTARGTRTPMGRTAWQPLGPCTAPVARRSESR